MRFKTSVGVVILGLVAKQDLATSPAHLSSLLVGDPAVGGATGSGGSTGSPVVGGAVGGATGSPAVGGATGSTAGAVGEVTGSTGGGAGGAGSEGVGSAAGGSGGLAGGGGGRTAEQAGLTLLPFAWRHAIVSTSDTLVEQKEKKSVLHASFSAIKRGTSTSTGVS